MTRTLMTLAAAALLVGGCSRVEKSEMTTANTMTSAMNPSLTRSDWDAVRARTIFFGHQSIGENILDGLTQIASGEGWPAFRLVDGAAARDGEAALLHSKVGQNGDPISKIAGFASGLEAGAGARADIAVMKFCFWDIRADTNVGQVFDEYRKMVARVEQKFPELTLVHATVPLVVQDNDWRARIKRMLGSQVPTDLDNLRREALNKEIRAAYGDRVFDIARAEGDPASASAAGVPYLANGFSSDGAHLNSSGKRRVAEAFVRSLAAAARVEAR